MSVQLFVLDRLFRHLMKRRFASQPDVLELRAMMEMFARRGRPVPRRIALDSIELGGVRTERLQSAGADQSRALLYIHGGAFVAGSPRNHRALTWRLAEKLRRPVYAIDYRLAPEHPFPAALEDAASAYRALLAQGIAPQNIFLAGDSAGGNLSLTLLLKLKAAGLPQPGAVVAMSPPTDFLHPFESRNSNAKSDAMFDRRLFGSVIPHYCKASDPADPLLSPLRGDLQGLPRTLLFCADNEMLRDDSVLFADKLKLAGVEVRLERWPKVFHAWPVVADHLPEARRAIDLMAEFLLAR